jgi:hypothetical protein
MMSGVIDYRPPDFGSLQFIDCGDGSWRALITDANQLFWRFWSTLGTRSRLTKSGFKLCVESDDDVERWHLEFRAPPDFDGDKIEKVIAVTNEQLRELPQPLFGESRDVVQRRQRVWDLNNERSERDIVRRISKIERDAKSLLDEYGEFASDRPMLRALVTSRDNWPHDAERRVRKAREKTERRARVRLEKAALEVDVVGAVDWPDDQVIRAVRFLTVNDDDHASLANDRGWSSSDSAAGHWCFKMLKDHEHRDVALKAARQIVGRYNRQLSIAGIIGRAA